MSAEDGMSEIDRLTQRVRELEAENLTLRNAGVTMLDRAERAESELAALRRRIADAPSVAVNLACYVDEQLPPEFALNRVRLVVEEPSGRREGE